MQRDADSNSHANPGVDTDPVTGSNANANPDDYAKRDSFADPLRRNDILEPGRHHYPRGRAWRDARRGHALSFEHHGGRYHWHHHEGSG
jgi:hypothetical protein